MTTPTFPFLSPEWIDAARAVRERHRGSAPTVPPVRANLVVTATPFGDGGGDPAAQALHAHLDSSGGELDLELGHVERPDATITLEWATARALFVQQDVQAFMQAFFGGAIVVQGDITKLLALQAAMPITPEAQAAAAAAAAELASITER